MEPMTTVISAIEAFKLVGSATEKLGEFAAEKIGAHVNLRIRKWRNEANVRVIAERIHALVEVKTFWSFDKEVSLYEFYYPPLIEFFHPTLKPVNGIGDFGVIENFVIQGTVGQGKSIFLRHLCGQEFRRDSSSGRIPVFAEFKRMQAGHTVKDTVYDALRRYDFDVDDELFDVYARSGTIVLLLDGFDELDAAHVPAAIDCLESWATRYRHTLQMFVTARPGSAIQRSSFFRVTKLGLLQPSMHQPFLERVCRDKVQAGRMQRAISNSTVEIKNLLTTPLLMTLLVVLYGSHEQIPATVPAFYEQLFEMLFYRHDRSKPGFSRERYTSLNDRKVRELFEAFCFYARASQLVMLTPQQYHECQRDAAAICGIDVDPRAFKDEITKVACLLQEEGFNLSFIHKSVAEYHAAAFIYNSTEQVQEGFYKELRNLRNWANWRQELKFLEEIDSGHFTRFFLRPSAIQVLDELRIEVNGRSRYDPTVLAPMLNKIRLQAMYDSSGAMRFSCITDDDNNYVKEEFQADMAAGIEQALSSAAPNSDVHNIAGGLFAEPGGVRVARLASMPQLARVVQAAYESAAAQLGQRLKEAEELVDSERRKLSIIRAVSGARNK